jgi:6-pyruvoyl-tetrahydropterin synthase
MSAVLQERRLYSVIVEATFSASHRLRLADGSWEPLHGHDWRVWAVFSRANLDEAGMVMDFHAAQSALMAVVAPLHHGLLNEHPAWLQIPPTAESVARHVFDRLLERGWTSLRAVRVREAPGCDAVYESSGGPHHGSGGEFVAD